MKFALKLLLKKFPVSKLLPWLLRLAAGGSLDELLKLKSYPIKRLYWKTAGLKTYTGAGLAMLGAALETGCALYVEMLPWACDAAHATFVVGAALTAVGLIDAGVRSPWPKGTDIPTEAKRG